MAAVPRIAQRWRVSGTLGVEVVASLKEEAAKIVKEVSKENLSANVNVADTPDFMQHTIYVITSIGDLEARAQGRLPIDAAVEDDRRTPAEEEDQSELLYKFLLQMIKGNKNDMGTGLMIGASLLNVVNPMFYDQFRAIIEAYGGNVYECSLVDFLITYPQYEDDDPFDVSFYRDANAMHFVFASSLLLTLIGKQLNSKNYVNWMVQRTKSFAAPLGLSPDDTILKHMKPSMQFCESFHRDVKIYWRVKILFFMNIYAFGQRGDLLASGMRVTLSLLKGAELTNHSMIAHWIGVLNLDLLCWNELAHYIPFLHAAQQKDSSIGPMAPWCKLILPPSEVTEFTSDRLSMLYAVARAISSKYGSSTVDQIDGIESSQTTKKVIAHALQIVAAAGRARTIEVMALREWRYNGYTNRDLVKLLDEGATESPVIGLANGLANVGARLAGETEQ